MTRLFIVRHGETEWNKLDLLQGSTDIPLSDAGREQARIMAAVLSQLVSPDAVLVSSPLSRAHDTGLALGAVLGVPVALDDRLRERAYGVWEGITPEARLAGWPAEVEEWHAHGNPGIEGFEVHELVAERVAASIEEWAGRATSDLVVFSHGSSARIGMMGLLGLSLNHRTLGNLGNTCWSRLRHRPDGRWQLERHNVWADVVYVGGVA
ncbi:histidine phosphatase family protein [Demequina sp.]|uniref:histidine phosphatase family protein n=1 Tax=Demequina sp. TaxID=2050685 RepID=UPI003D0FC5B5